VNASGLPPVLYFTDLTGGPRSGNGDTSRGQIANQNGAIVTVWGENLGASQGTSTITLGGAAPAAIYYWGNATAPNCGPATLYNQFQKFQCIIFQVGGATPTGSQTIQVTMGGLTSNTLPFTVNATGRMLFAKPGGGGLGTYTSPYSSVQTLLNALGAGDIGYVMDGFSTVVSQPPFTVSPTGVIVLVTYPGATLTLGSPSVDGIQDGPSGYGGGITFAKIDVQGLDQSVTIRENSSLIGNRFQCPNGRGPAGCIGIFGSNVKMLGNEVTNAGTSNPSLFDNLYHTIYIYGRRGCGACPFLESGREVGWNYIHDNAAFRAVNIYNGENGANNPISDHNVHDNVILNQEGDGILFGRGVVGKNSARNNLIINAGLHNVDTSTSSGETCVNLQMSDPPGVSVPHDATVTVVSNNTMLNCGRSTGGTNSGVGVFAINQAIGVTNIFANLVYQQAVSFPYVTAVSTARPSNADSTKYSNNLWFGAGTPPTWDTNSVNSDPLLISATNPYDLHLQASSPAIGAGVNLTSLGAGLLDFDGYPRTTSGAWDIGAYQFGSFAWRSGAAGQSSTLTSTTTTVSGTLGQASTSPGPGSTTTTSSEISAQAPTLSGTGATTTTSSGTSGGNTTPTTTPTTSSSTTTSPSTTPSPLAPTSSPTSSPSSAQAFTRGTWTQYGAGTYGSALFRGSGVAPYDVLADGRTSVNGKTMQQAENGSGGEDALLGAYSSGGVYVPSLQQFVTLLTTGHFAGGSNEVNVFDLTTGTWNPSGRPVNPTVRLFMPENGTWPSAIAYAGIHLT